MRKSYLLLLLLFFCGIAQAQTMDLADPVLKNLLVNTNCVDTDNNGTPDADVDTNNDGEIDGDESGAVNKLYIDGPVTSMEGFQGWFSPDLLSIQHTLLTSLTLSNYFTQDIIVKNNAQLIALSFSYVSCDSIDCSDNNLSVLLFNNTNDFLYLDCSGNNLTSLNLNNFSVYTLNCSNNNLHTLNLFSFTNLGHLNCSNNQLTSIAVPKWMPFETLDFSGNPNVTSICCWPDDLTLFQQKAAQYGLTGVTYDSNCTFNPNPCPAGTICFGDPAFKSYLVINTETDTNHDGEIQFAEAAAVTSLTVSGNINSLTGLNYFTNLTYLKLTSLQVGLTYDLQSFSHLVSLEVSWNNALNEVNINGLTNLQHLIISHNTVLAVIKATGLTGLVDAEVSENNNLGTLTFPGATALTTLTCNDNYLNTLNLTNCTGLVTLDAHNNYLTSMTIGATTSLAHLNFYNNKLTACNFSAMSNLQELNFGRNLFTTVNLTGLNSVQSIDVSDNKLYQLDASNLPNLLSLNTKGNYLLTDIFLKNNNTVADLQTVTLTGNYSLVHICADTNDFTAVQAGINTAGLINVTINATCSCSGACADSVVFIPNANFKAKLVNSTATNYVARNLSGQYFAVDANGDGQIQRSEAANVYSIKVSASSITSMEGINSFVNLGVLDCSQNNTPSLDVSHCSQLAVLTCSISHMTSLNISGLKKINSLDCGVNQLTSLDVSNLEFLNTLTIAGNPQMTTLLMKNGSIESTFNYSSMPGLLYICADDEQVDAIATGMLSQGNTQCVVNSYCSFTPGGTYYTINGKSTFDFNGNGCDASDIVFPDMKINIDNGVITNTVIPAFYGNYSYFLKAGSYTISPAVENPTYFNVSPASYAVTFPDLPSPQNHEFCISANGVHRDVEVLLLPLNTARPGFDANYKIVFRNKGNQVLSGDVNFSYDDTVLDFVSSDVASTHVENILTWAYTGLMPFETRTITFSLNLNSPTEEPSLNDEDELYFAAFVTCGGIDETPLNNNMNLLQVVHNSHDPNDKTCLEGNTITTEMVGREVHYMIRFENTGTANAENIVVKDMIDTTKYDVSTLIPLNGSHSYVTKITNTNKVEFIFENINLPFDDANNDGYVAFKIKTKPTLTVGDTFSNNANIYFDYNAPIVTNTATTTVTTLGTTDFDFNTLFCLSPVPTKSELTITSKQSVTISSISIYNMLGQLVQVAANPANTIDVTNLKAGNYFIKIHSDKGTTASKFIKE